MNNHHQKTLAAVYAEPVRSDVRWSEVENLLFAEGAEGHNGHGSRFAVHLNGKVAVFHRPHPGEIVDKGALRSVRDFLDLAGVRPALQPEAGA